MADDAQRARRRAHNTRALEHCNAMGRTAGSILWQPLQTRDGKWFMPDGSELAEAPMEWRSERLNTILDEMDERDAVFPLCDPPPTALEMLKNTQAWETEVNGQWDAGQSRMEMSDYKQKVDAALATRLDLVETHHPGPDGSPYGWNEIALVKTTMPRAEYEELPRPVITAVRIAGEEFKEGDPIFAGTDGKVYRTRVRPAPPPSKLDAGNYILDTEGVIRPAPSTISLEDLEMALQEPGNEFYEVPEPFKQYRRSQIAELRPYDPDDDISGISISLEDVKAGSPKPGDMIARNPKNHADQWLVAEQYFKDNFEPVE